MPSLSTLEGGAKKIISIAFVLGIGLILLGKFTDTTFLRGVLPEQVNSTGHFIGGTVTTVNTSIGNTLTGLASISDWIGIIVIVIIGAYLLYAFKRK